MAPLRTLARGGARQVCALLFSTTYCTLTGSSRRQQQHQQSPPSPRAQATYLPTKTSAVHFLRWEFSESSIKGLKENPNISMGVDHDKYSCNQIITKSIVDELTSDFN